MPRERTILTAAPPTPADWLAALRTVVPEGDVQVLAGAAAQLVDQSGAVLVTAVRPREVPFPEEPRRLLGTDGGERPRWSDIVVPEDAAALVDRVLSALAERCDGVIA